VSDVPAEPATRTAVLATDDVEIESDGVGNGVVRLPCRLGVILIEPVNKEGHGVGRGWGATMGGDEVYDRFLIISGGNLKRREMREGFVGKERTKAR
jgi:hypothetical protein